MRFERGGSVVKVCCYLEESEALEEECIITKNVCVVQSMQQEAKRIEHVETYVHVHNCEERMILQIVSL